METYTFEFMTLRNGGQEGHRKQVPLTELLPEFDKAMQWKREAPDGESRFASLYGPGVMRCAVDELTRRRIVRITPVPQAKKEVIGILWSDCFGPEDGYWMSMHKVIQITEYQVDAEPEITYRMEIVESTNHDVAFDWIKAHFWRDFGIWFKGKPGLVFTPDFEAVEKALLAIPAAAWYLETGRLVRAPVRYEWGKADQPLYIKSTRDRAKIMALRSRYPTASEDMMYVPLDILIHRHGYGMQSGMDVVESPALAAG